VPIRGSTYCVKLRFGSSVQVGRRVEAAVVSEATIGVETVALLIDVGDIEVIDAFVTCSTSSGFA